MTQPENSIQKQKHNTIMIVSSLALIGGLAPLILYWLIYGQVSIITPPDAKELLLAENTQAVLVDIRAGTEFNAAHIDGSVHWPVDEIMSTENKEQVPDQLKSKTLLLICDAGISSSFATKHLMNIGLAEVMNVRGGIQEWIGSATGPDGGIFERYTTSAGEIKPFPTRISPLYEKLLAVISGFAIKPIYSFLSLILIIILWRSKAPDLVALRWSMIFFFLGENCCALNFLLYVEKCYSFEYLHSYGMLLSFAFATYAVFEGIDSRILMLSEPNKKCAALSLCKKCIKYETVPCRLKQTFFMIIPAAILLAFMPITSDWHSTSYNTMIFGTFHNYSHRVIYQQFEFIYCPIAAIILLTISLSILAFKKDDPLPLAKIFFAAGIGPLGFGMFRSILAGMYSTNMVWFNFWEEGTELLFIIGVCFILWTFRQSLWHEKYRSE
jgi:rhodanese-related sulfurtransferase